MKKTIILKNDGETLSPQKNSNFNLFLENAFFFLAHRERIMSDPKMSYAIVDGGNGLAYSGASELKNTTLGCYLDWWDNCLNSIDIDENGSKWVICRVSGSPLSGRNSCLAINENYKVKCIQHPSFHNLWKTLMVSNKRFNDETLQQEAYSLQEVMSELLQAPFYVESNLHIFFLERIIRRQNDQINTLNKTNLELLNRIKHDLINSKIEELHPLMNQYVALKEKTHSRLSILSSMKLNLRKKLKQGLIDNHHYQRIFTYLKKRINNQHHLISNYRYMVINTLFKGENINFSDILTYYPTV